MAVASFRVEYAKGDFLVVSRGQVKAFVNRGEKSRLFRLSDSMKIDLACGNCRIKAGKLLLGSNSSCILSENSTKI